MLGVSFAAPQRAGRKCIAALLLTVTVSLGACAGTEPTPEQARRDRVEARLRETFTKAQSSCILGLADDRVLTALDKEDDLAGDDATMKAYTNAVIACVSGDEEPQSTTTSSTGAGGTTP